MKSRIPKPESRYGTDSFTIGGDADPRAHEPVEAGAGTMPCLLVHLMYRGTSLIRNSAPLGPCSRTMPRALWWS